MIDDEPQDTPPEEPTPEAEAPAPAPEVDDDSPSPAPEAPVEDAPADESPAEEAPAPAAEEPPADDAPAPAAEDAPAPAAEEAPAEDAPAADVTPAAEEAPAAEQRPRRERNPQRGGDEPEVIPGAHLEPDLVLDETATDPEADPYADPDASPEDQAAEADEAPQPLATTIIDLAADARYLATGKRKSAVARVTIKPGTGVYTVNGKELDVFFPRPTLQRACRGPLETVGQQERLDVVAKIHGGGVSAQAGALRHGIARALVEADPNLRGELKRRGFLTRDPRVKERKKAGLKKARKRPQFSKR
jgi:small subunit ribosomal protein S9